MTERELDALLDDSAEDLYENAPCGYLSTTLDGRIVKINKTLLDWLGRTRAEVVDRSRFTDLLTVGGRIYHETHFAPLLRMQGSLSGVALVLRTASGEQLPVLVTSVVKTLARTAWCGRICFLPAHIGWPTARHAPGRAYRDDHGAPGQRRHASPVDRRPDRGPRRRRPLCVST